MIQHDSRPKRPGWMPAVAVIALLCAVSALSGCGKKAVVEESKQRWVRIKHVPVEKTRAGHEVPIQAEVVSGPGSEVRAYVFYRAQGEPYQVAEMRLLGPGSYFGSIPPFGRGVKVDYYIEARAGADLITRVPAREKAESFHLLFKGKPNRYILITHVVFIFVALFFFLLSGYLGYKSLKDRRSLLYIPRVAFLGTIAFFIASIPLGMVVAYQTYGKPWTGFPVGTDLTDNKSLGILLYWVVCGVLFRGSLFRRDPSRDLVSMGSMPYVYIVGAAITAVLFLLPH
jgi:hypothetical protein